MVNNRKKNSPSSALKVKWFLVYSTYFMASETSLTPFFPRTYSTFDKFMDGTSDR
jgi:hypothetical protein